MADVDCFWISVITVLFAIITVLSLILLVVSKKKISCCKYEIIFRSTASNTDGTIRYSELLNRDRDEDGYGVRPQLPPRLPISRLNTEQSPRRLELDNQLWGEDC